MKQTIYILTILILTGCGQSNSEEKIESVYDSTQTNSHVESTLDSSENEHSEIENSEDISNEDDGYQETLSEFEKATLFKLTDTIIADFNGDGNTDRAVYKKENNKSGILIKHGQTNEEFRIGFGKKFAHMTEFDWVDYWGLVEDKETFETTFTDEGDVDADGNKKVKLENPSIVLGAYEVGGGLITYRNGKYVWIHQTC